MFFLFLFFSMGDRNQKNNDLAVAKQESARRKNPRPTRDELNRA